MKYRIAFCAVVSGTLSLSVSHTAAQTERPDPSFLPSDAQGLEQELARITEDLLVISRRGLTASLPPENAKAQRCTKLNRIVTQRKDESRTAHDHNVREVVRLAIQAGIDAAPAKARMDAYEAAAANLGKDTHGDPESERLAGEFFEPLGELLNAPIFHDNAEHVAQYLLTQLAALQARDALECNAVIDDNALAAEMEMWANQDPNAALSYFGLQIKNTKFSGDPEQERRQRLQLFAKAARDVVSYLQRVDANSEQYRDGLGALAYIAGRSKSSQMSRTRSTKMSIFDQQDLRLIALAEQLFQRLPESGREDIAAAIGVPATSLRLTDRGATGQMAAFSDQQARDSLRLWATQVADGMLDSPSAFEDALATLSGE